MKYFAIIASAFVLMSSHVMAEGDAKKGERVFKKCAACHTTEPGKKKPGPHLQNILGREAGNVDGFKYSKAMSGSGVIWDADNLRAFLAKPKAFMPKTKMSFPGLKKDTDLDNLIAYLSGL